MDKKDVLLFQVNTLLMAVPVSCILTIRPCPERVTRIPGSPGYVIGTYILEGEKITLIDTAKLLGFKEGESVGIEAKNTLIILSGGIGLAVEKGVGVEKLTECDSSFQKMFLQNIVWTLLWSENRKEVAYELDTSKILQMLQ